MRNPFKRRPRSPVQVALTSATIHHDHTVRIEYPKRQKPDYLYIQFTGPDGRQWSIQPLRLSERYGSVPIDLPPVSFLTGRDTDVSIPPTRIIAWVE